MIFQVRVKPKASQSGVEFWGENRLVVKVKAVPEKGQANEELRRLLADFFSCPKEAVQIKSGLCSKWKIVEIVGLKSWQRGLDGGKK